MRLLVIGCGQCGGRIADEFARLNQRAKKRRGIEITPDVIAVNTDAADLSGLTAVPHDYRHRILIGAQRTGGHGVGKINEVGAEIAREEGEKILETIRAAHQAARANGFLLVSSAAGGTGSGAISLLTQQIKERFPEKPVYNLIALPFRHEEITEGRTIYNTATCLKSVYLVADAVFLVDNQRYIRKHFSMQENLKRINTRVVEPFYDLLCAAEEKKPKYIASKILDAGDIIQSLAGWTVIGHGRAKIPSSMFHFGDRSNFRDKAAETYRGTEALREAISELSLKCSPGDAKRGLYLLSAPGKELGMEMVEGMGITLRGLAKEAMIRGGDYPRGKDYLSVTLVLSELTSVPKVAEYFTKAINYINSVKKRQEGLAYQQKSIEAAFKDIPSLL